MTLEKRQPAARSQKTQRMKGEGMNIVLVLVMGVIIVYGVAAAWLYYGIRRKLSL